MLPLMAYNYFTVATRDQPQAALDGTLEAIRNQTDGDIRKGMAAGFVTAHPDLRASLYRGLDQAHIALPDVAPADNGYSNAAMNYGFAKWLLNGQRR